MKTFITAVVTAALLFATAPFIASAQEDKNGFALNPSRAAASPASETKAYSGEDASAVNQKALKDFSKTFKNVTDHTWYKDARGSYIASFISGGIDTKAVYDEKGRWLYNLLTYPENKLSFEVRDLVKKTWYDFDILVCHEYEIQGGPVYIIKMQDEKTLKTIRIINGEMTVIADYVRG